jgi:hypothetical protein
MGSANAPPRQDSQVDDWYRYGGRHVFTAQWYARSANPLFVLEWIMSVATLSYMVGLTRARRTMGIISAALAAVSLALVWYFGSARFLVGAAYAASIAWDRLLRRRGPIARVAAVSDSGP